MDQQELEAYRDGAVVVHRFPTLTWEPSDAPVALERLHQIDNDIIEHVFDLIKHIPISQQRLILVGYLAVRSERILKWAEETR